MTRLDSWRKNVKIDYPEDLAKIRNIIPELKDISDAQIQDMYSFWSEYFYCASWHVIFAGVVEEFRDWILEEVTEPEILW